MYKKGWLFNGSLMIFVLIMQKDQLRNAIKLERDQLSVNDLAQMSGLITNNLLGAFQWKKKRINVFLPIKQNKEIDLRDFIKKVLKLDGNICINRTDFSNKKMTPIEFNQELQIKNNKYGIPEPVEGKEVQMNDIDIVIVPLLCFNANGHRLGYGGGFYDRFLKLTKSTCIKIGVCHFAEPRAIHGIESTDMVLDFLVSPQGVRKFSIIT